MNSADRLRRLGDRTRKATLVAALAGLVVGCGTAEAGLRTDGEPDAEVVRSTSIVFRVDVDQRITVIDADTDRTLRVLPPGEGGFLRGALRPLDRERDRHGVSRDRPYELTLHDDGALILRDPPTGLHLDVAAFGPTSRAQFLDLMGGPSDRPAPSLSSTPNGTMEDRP